MAPTGVGGGAHRYLVYIFTLFLLFSDFKKKTYKGDDKKSK